MWNIYSSWKFLFHFQCAQLKFNCVVCMFVSVEVWFFGILTIIGFSLSCERVSVLYISYIFSAMHIESLFSISSLLMIVGCRHFVASFFFYFFLSLSRIVLTQRMNFQIKLNLPFCMWNPIEMDMIVIIVLLLLLFFSYANDSTMKLSECLFHQRQAIISDAIQCDYGD